MLSCIIIKLSSVFFKKIIPLGWMWTLGMIIFKLYLRYTPAIDAGIKCLARTHEDFLLYHVDVFHQNKIWLTILSSFYMKISEMG